MCSYITRKEYRFFIKKRREKMDPMITGGLIGTGSDIIGMALQPIKDRQQLKQQGKLIEQQIKAQKEMGLYNQGLALDTWEKTGYEAQRKQMEKAGLNVGLMYEGGGAGGTTSTPTGTVTGGTAQQSTGSAAGGLAIQMRLEKSLKEAQINNINKDTEKKETERKEIEARTPTYEKGIQKTDAEIEEIASKIGVNKEAVKKMIEEEAKIEAEKTRITTLTPLEAEKTKADTLNTQQQTAIGKQTEIGKIIENKYKDSIESTTLQKLISEIGNIQQNKSYTASKERNEAIINVLDDLIKRKEISEDTGNSLLGIILKFIK